MSKPFFLLTIISFLFVNCSNPTLEQKTTAQVENRGVNKENWWDNLPRSEWTKFKQIKTKSNWFEVYQITPNIIAIYEPGQFEEVISYLITGKEKALLWDTGTGIGDMKKLVNKLTSLEIIVLNSHTHYDHVGGNYQFETIYGLNDKFTHKNAKGKAHKIAKEFISGDWIWKPTPSTFSKETYESKPFNITKTIMNGSKIDLGGIILEVIQTPGIHPMRFV